jgi:hypothetical protein
MRAPAVTVLLAVALAACRTVPGSTPEAPRYLVTASPIDTGVSSQRLCVAVDAADAHGVWWWEPGHSGCSGRSTGPGVFRAERGNVVAAGASAPIEVEFRLQLHRAPGASLPEFVEVRLTIEAGAFRAGASGDSVATARPADLDLPEQPPNR